MRADWQIEVKETRVRGRASLSACSESTHGAMVHITSTYNSRLNRRQISHRASLSSV